jgi:hypothetical protein
MAEVASVGKETVRIMTPDANLMKTGYPAKVAAAFEADPSVYDQRYGTAFHPEFGYRDAAALAKLFEDTPGVYDEVLSKAEPNRENTHSGPSRVPDGQLVQLLDRVIAAASTSRDSALADTTVSLVQRLGLDDEQLARTYDATYGRPRSEG